LLLNASGNLGLGVTPSAWWNGFNAIQLGTNAPAFLLGRTDNQPQVHIGANAFFDGTNWKYVATAASARYQTSGAEHQWHSAASGTAGNNITFTQAMTLDADGRLALGATGILGTSNRASFVNSTSAKGVLALQSTSTSGYSAIELYDSGGTQQGAMGWGNASVAVTGAASAAYLYSTGAITFLAGGTTERARITSGGEFLVGKTINTVSAEVGCNIRADGVISAVCSSSTDAFNSYYLYSTGAAAFRFYVGANGVINATNTAITAISDQRLKENIRDLDVGLDAVMALKPRKFDWKSGKGKDTKNDRGWIAQEFEQIFPDLVSNWADEPPEGEEPYKAVRPDLIPVLVKAIQEQQAMIDDLKAKVAALETK